MTRESDFIATLRALAGSAAARGLLDDAAVLATPAGPLVLTHDMIVEGVHYLPDDPPEDVAWKLVAVNLSDLAGKGARPLGVLLGYPLGDAEWDARFVAGLREVLARFDVPLLGGDTVSSGSGARTLGLTALGEAPPTGAPARNGARAGDTLYVTGRIGAAGLGLAVARGEAAGPPEALAAYRRPLPRLAEGRLLAPSSHAMMDVSDGLLIDAARMAAASGIGLTLEVHAIPLAAGYTDDRTGRLAAAIAGDDYELLLAAPAGLTLPGETPLTAIGRFHASAGLNLVDTAGPVPPPARLGYEHDA